MSEKKPEGGPVYPVQDLSKWQCPGMTLRQWYAGMALHGLCSSSELLQKFLGTAGELGTTFLDVLATSAFEAADAMIAHEAAEREGT